MPLTMAKPTLEISETSTKDCTDKDCGRERLQAKTDKTTDTTTGRGAQQQIMVPWVCSPEVPGSPTYPMICSMPQESPCQKTRLGTQPRQNGKWEKETCKGKGSTRLKPQKETQLTGFLNMEVGTSHQAARRETDRHFSPIPPVTSQQL